jgi:hypothetical protein
MIRSILAVSILALGAACETKNQESTQKPQAGTLLSTEAVHGSVNAVAEGGLLNLPGNYVRNTVGQVNEAKAAKALYEETEKERLKSLEFTDTGGR